MNSRIRWAAFALLVLLGCATGMPADKKRPADVAPAVQIGSNDEVRAGSADPVGEAAGSKEQHKTDYQAARAARVLPTPEAVPADFGFPPGTVVHQMIIGPEERDRVTRGSASMVMWALRDCSREGRCRDHLLLFGENRHNPSVRRDKRMIVEEFSTEGAAVEELKFISAPPTATNHSIRVQGVFEILAVSEVERFKFCVWAIGFDRYQSLKLAPSAQQSVQSCPVFPPSELGAHGFQ